MKPLVSICCLSYNQKDYIAQTLESMLAQKCDFGFEILIHDDASTDGTDEIIRSYAERFPEIIFPLYETENQFSKGPVRNISGIFNFPRARGKYIAMCEGDDYWCDERKLSVQAAFMEAHDDCTLCFHSAWQLNGGLASAKKMMRPYDRDRRVSPEEIINKTVGYPTASLMLRTEVMQELPDFYMRAPIGDIPMQLAMAARGWGYYLDRPMCAYRYFAPGSWTRDMYGGDFAAKQERYAAEMKTMYEGFDRYTGGRYREQAREAYERILYRTKLNVRDWDHIFDPANERFFRELGPADRAALRFERRMPGIYKGLQKLCRPKNGN